MIIRESGNIAYNLYMLGPPENPVYLLDGSHPILFDAGFACLGPVYEGKIRSLLGERHPDYLLLSHCHFDHCGAIAYLKKRFPRMTVAGSPLSAKIIERPNAVRWMESLSEDARKMNHGDSGAPPFEPFELDRFLCEGDRIEADEDAMVRVLETPGHTRDCLSFFIPSLNALICSEAAGISDLTGYIYIDFLIGYEPYRASLLKIQALNPDIVCLGHHTVYTGPDARMYLADALRHCDDFFHLVQDRLRETGGDIPAVMEGIRKHEYDPKPWPKQTESAYLMNLEARVKAVQRLMEAP